MALRTPPSSPCKRLGGPSGPHAILQYIFLLRSRDLKHPYPVVLGHGVSAQQGVLKVAHSNTLGRLRPHSWHGGSGGIAPAQWP